MIRRKLVFSNIKSQNLVSYLISHISSCIGFSEIFGENFFLMAEKEHCIINTKHNCQMIII